MPAQSQTVHRDAPAPASAPPDLAMAYDAHATGIHRALRKLGVPEASIEDAVHDVFIVAWRRRDDFAGRSTVRTWLYGIALRVARDHRHKRDRSLRELEFDGTPLAAADASPEQVAEHANLVERLDLALATLHASLREAFVLVEIEQLSGVEVAQVLDVPLNTVYSRVRRARAGLRAALVSSGESEA